MKTATTFFLALCLALCFSFHAAAQPAPFDCRADKNFQAFAFWLGDWEVKDGAGTVVGKNSITLAPHGCLMHEHWQSARQTVGHSQNYYDPRDQKWHQLWVDGSGIIDISGQASDGKLELSGSIYYFATQTQAPFKGTWTLLEDGSVRQFFQQQDDQGEWQVWFEGFYHKTKPVKDS